MQEHQNNCTMLDEITIRNFAIIDDLTLRFDTGFNVMTGETGAGKSIVFDAASMLLGARADSNDVRAGAEDAFIEGIFELSNPYLLDKINEVLEREGLEFSDEEPSDTLVIAREIRRSGRSLTRINGRTTTVSVLREISQYLIDIHGQGEHLSLLKPKSHLDLLDRYGSLTDQRSAFGMLVKQVDKVRKQLRHLIENEEELQRRSNTLTQMVTEIDAMELQVGEDDELAQEGKRLGNAEQLATLASEAQGALTGGTEEAVGTANDLITEAAAALAKLARVDEDTKDMAALAEELSVQVEELAASIADYQETVEADPVRLTHVEIRLESINGLLKRYNCDTIEELLKASEEAAVELQQIEGGEEKIKALQAEEADLLKQISEAGAALSAARSEAAQQMAAAVEAELADLRMETARFGVMIEQNEDENGVPVGEYVVAFDRTGIDTVEFMLSPNIGEPLKPMARIASGGETSRIMLALKTVLSRVDDTPTLIFDEIDTGIGGRIGAVVGEKLWSLSTNHQVLVVTHLPQLAGFADTHFKVEKGVVNSRTTTTVFPLEHELQITELSAMLGAETESSKQSAQEILDYVSEVKQQYAGASAG